MYLKIVILDIIKFMRPKSNYRNKYCHSDKIRDHNCILRDIFYLFINILILSSKSRGSLNYQPWTRISYLGTKLISRVCHSVTIIGGQFRHVALDQN